MAGTDSFRIDSVRADTRYTLTPAGDLDSDTSQSLMEALDRAAAELGQRELHLDLAGLSFIDSSGLRAIIQVERTAREQGWALIVTPPPAPLIELLELTGVAERLTLGTQDGAPPVYRSFVERVELDLPSEPTAPRRARAEVRQAGQGLDRRTLDAGVLLASELVTNAVIHPVSADRYRVELRITRFEDGIRCEVSDPGAGFDPADLGRREPETGGRGLMLVDALASRWGVVRRSGDGDPRFCVWFEVEAPAEAAGGALAGHA